ncbi:hypothetical protein ACF08M_40915 [Streptomyces sp. NPDC015032]|uniref:hypothetical protein n=1 Tax=Streptomyces sp. NPDC015032 TaxID=3364937 RepID=UPI0036FA5E15
MMKTTTTTTTTLRLTDPAVREQLEVLPASKVLIGLGGDARPVCVDLGSESPHVLVCSASGGGTYTTLRALAAQLLPYLSPRHARPRTNMTKPY